MVNNHLIYHSLFIIHHSSFIIHHLPFSLRASPCTYTVKAGPDRLVISTPDFSPYGNPIPGLDDFGMETNPNFGDGVVSVVDLPRAFAGQNTYVLRRIGEPLQVDVKLLSQLNSLGLTPGSSLSVEYRGMNLFISNSESDEGLEISEDLARHLFVEA